MKAIVVREYGGPEVLRLEDVTKPVPAAVEVLVKVAAASINPFDFKRRNGSVRAYAPITFPGILGIDVSGTVEAPGPGVKNFSVGDRVFAMADKTHAEFCVVKAEILAKIPEGLDLIEAAALPLVLITGSELANGTEVGPGQTVLVTGAVGSVGRSAAFTAKQKGARVIAGVRKNRLEKARTIGADDVVAPTIRHMWISCRSLTRSPTPSAVLFRIRSLRKLRAAGPMHPSSVGLQTRLHIRRSKLCRSTRNRTRKFSTRLRKQCEMES